MTILTRSAIALGVALGAAASAHATTVTFDISGDLTDIGAYTGAITLDVTGGLATSGSGTVNGLGFTGVPVVLITPSTPGNEGSGGSVGFRGNDGTDYFGLDAAYPIDTNGLLFDVGTTTASFGQFPLLALFSNGDGTFGSAFTGNVLGTEFYNESGTLTITPTGVPEPATWAVVLAGFGGIGAAMRKRRSERTAVAA